MMFRLSRPDSAVLLRLGQASILLCYQAGAAASDGATAEIGCCMPAMGAESLSCSSVGSVGGALAGVLAWRSFTAVVDEACLIHVA